MSVQQVKRIILKEIKILVSEGFRNIAYSK